MNANVTNTMKILRLLCLLSLVAFGRLAEAGPRIEHWTAPSGARVFFVESRALPMLDVQVDFAAGSARDPQDKPGVAALTHALLDMGAADMDETAISNRLADIGAQILGGIEKDRASARLRTLAEAGKRDAALAIFRAVLSSPQFPTAVFEREKARTLAGLKESLTRPDAIASRAFWADLYPAHAYGRNATPESVAAIERNDLESFYRNHYNAAGAVVTIVGDIARGDAEALAQKLTDGLPAAAGNDAPGAPDLPRAAEQRIPHPAAQAHVLIGTPSLKRGDPDFFALQVGNYTLGGGGFVSRLMNEVREKRGFAYSVYSYFMPMLQPGPFQIGLQTKKEQAGEALKVTREVLAKFLADGPTAEELAAAKQNIAGSFPLRLDSNGKILDNVAVIGFYGLPLDYLETYIGNVEKVTVDDVRAAFARHVKAENLVTVVVGGE